MAKQSTDDLAAALLASLERDAELLRRIGDHAERTQGRRYGDHALIAPARRLIGRIAQITGYTLNDVSTVERDATFSGGLAWAAENYGPKD